MDIPQVLRQFNQGRDPELLALKWARMRAGAFAFLRGSCHLFVQRLAGADALQATPRVWVCGDLHLDNYGSYKGDDRQPCFDINDFDEAALAPCGWDVLRLLTSLHLGLAERPLPPADIEGLVQTFIAQYAHALARGKARRITLDTSEGLVHELLDTTRARTRPAFLDARTRKDGKQRQLRTDGRKALPATEAQRQAVLAFMDTFAASQEDPKFFQPLDVARRVAGTGSLGISRYVVLVRGRGSPDGNFLLDLKQALPSALATGTDAPQPAWPSQAHRVVTLQKRMQAVSMAFLQPVQLGHTACVLRALHPSEDHLPLLAPGTPLHRLEHAMATLGSVLAWDHLRGAGCDGAATTEELMDFGQRLKQPTGTQALTELAAACAAQTRADWASYTLAYDTGRFAKTPG
jgi:uncharacterized protein (DUF2252 family)